MSALEEIKNRQALEKYYLFYAVRGGLHLELEQYREAEENFRIGLSLTSMPPEQNFLRKKLGEIKSAASH